MKKRYYILFYLRDLRVLCGYYIILNKFTTSPKVDLFIYYRNDLNRQLCNFD